MRNGRNNKAKPMGFDKAAAALSLRLSPEAAAKFTSLVKDVASQYSYNDSRSLKALNRRLNSAVRSRQPWAVEVAGLLASDDRPQVATN